MKKRCVIIGAAPFQNQSYLPIDSDDFIICADGGLDFAIAHHIRPDLVIGDFDSLLAKSDLSAWKYITLPTEKDDTDTMAAVKFALENGYTDFLLLNCTGGRLDHTFANFSVLHYLQTKNANGILLDGNCTATVKGVGRMEWNYLKGYGFSLFPFGCKTVCVSGEGFYYPLKNQILSAEFPLGVSNEICSDSAWISVQKGTVLIITEKK